MHRECNGAKHSTEATEVEYTIRKLIRVNKGRLRLSKENKKNGFAIAGFALSLVGVMVPVGVWFPIGHTPFELREIQQLIVWILFVDPINVVEPTWLIAILRVLEVLGIIFSSVGIAKTKKGFGGKKLAIAGLILGIISLLNITTTILDGDLLEYISNAVMRQLPPN